MNYNENIAGCNSDCSGCGKDCPSNQNPERFRVKPHRLSDVRSVIGIVSGKGGVGKSLVTALLAVLMSRRGFSSAILDADVTGPSVPMMFGVKDKALATDHGILPGKSKTGIEMISVNMLLPNETDPVVWRGPVISGMVSQFWSEVIWRDVDFMFVDMPPGTGDVPLTVFQSLPVDGILIVTSPQDLVTMVVEKAANMAKMMNIPVLGIVENMAYFKCPDCGSEHRIFGNGKSEETAEKFGAPVLGSIPVEPKLAAAADAGTLELFEGNWLDTAADLLEKQFGQKSTDDPANNL